MTPEHLPEDLEDEPERDVDDVDQEETHVRVSFFEASNVDAPLRDHDAWDAIEDADAAVCASVWSIYAKTSTAAGFDCRSAVSIRASRSLAARRAASGEKVKPPTYIHDTKMEDTMTKDEFAAAHAAFMLNHGRIPTAVELFEAIGSEGKSVQNVRQSIKRAGLTLAGARGPNKETASTATSSRRTSPFAAKAPPLQGSSRKTSEPAPSAIVVRREPRAKRGEVVVTTPLIADLTARRDALLADAEKLTAAIEVLRPAS